MRQGAVQKVKKGYITPVMMRLSKLCTEYLKAKDTRREHLKSVETSLNHLKVVCKVCRGDTYSEYKICGVFIHTIPVKGEKSWQTLFFFTMMMLFFYLACDHGRDSEVKKLEWMYPTQPKERGKKK